MGTTQMVKDDIENVDHDVRPRIWRVYSRRRGKGIRSGEVVSEGSMS